MQEQDSERGVMESVDEADGEFDDAEEDGFLRPAELSLFRRRGMAGDSSRSAISRSTHKVFYFNFQSAFFFSGVNYTTITYPIQDTVHYCTVSETCLYIQSTYT